ncbi:hypothetical protein JCM3775_007275 [Rhodotorula graminis]|uniref:TauD/TfdA-like domain-containing protein n=1 Tax=Rhodotorula graminis (strain WP1) TaxID=578459 RepID=A0A0P9GJG2_RHOGW|nr:uncharacterized protein RHOBADRAFT_46252 [Rhodotorula graminis WP1]KPV73147.1 hypothetical protein RHOBADRAFT_46252 [Rhodotorula graminis WP1]
MPVPASTLSTITIKPYEGSYGFGAEVSGIDLNTMSPEQFKELERAIYIHRVVVVKGQKDLLPETQQRMGVLFDPETPANLGHMEAVRGLNTIFGAGVTERKPTMPGGHLVNLNGSGSFKAGHYGVPKDFVLTGLSSKGFHRDELSHEQVESGHVRFQRWHIDWPACVGSNPAPVTTIWAHTLPTGEDVTVHWEDGEGTCVRSRPGQTAFIDCFALYRSLSPEQRAWVDNSLVEYPPSPYQWLRGAKADGLGLRMYDEGNETPLEDLAEGEPLRCPMVWINPITGERALQVHAIIARKLHYRSSPTAAYRLIDDLAEVREMLDSLQRPFVKPDNVFFAPTEEGDLLCFHNRGVRHSAVEFPESRGPRLLHQLQLIASDEPWNPKRVVGQPYYKDEGFMPPSLAIAGTA